MSEWIQVAKDAVSIDHSSGTLDVYIESNDFGARYIMIPISIIREILSIGDIIPRPVKNNAPKR